jgi:hypothetical protein
MSANLFLQLKANMLCIDFFGIPVPVPKQWYTDNHWLAIDMAGELFIYSNKPVLRDNHWACNERSWGNPQSIGEHILNLEFIDPLFENLDTWISDNWNKECWPVTTFPVLRTA